jgi:hypothetical protein
LVVPALFLWKPRRHLVEGWREPISAARRTVAIGCLVLAVATLVNAWPLGTPPFSSYESQLGYRPYQALVDVANQRGAVVLWSMTEARDLQSHAFGPLGTVTVRTDAHPEALALTSGYAGFGGLYQDTRTSVKPGELWDRLLQLPEHELRTTPVLIGELGFHGSNDAGKELHRLVTALWVKERTVVGVLEALRSGHSYAVGEGDHHVQLRLEEFQVVCLDGTKSASIGDRLDPGGARDLMVRLSVTAADHGHHPAKVRVIRSGQVVAQSAGETPFRFDWTDTTAPMNERMAYRVEITGSGELLSNPIFVAPILELKAEG